MAKRVLIPQDIAEAGKDYLRRRGYEIKLGSGITVDILKKEVQGCQAILARTARYPAEVLQAGKELKVISRHGVGYDNIDVEAATQLGIYITNAPLSNANSVAEHTIGLIIALARNFVRSDSALRSGDFQIRNRVIGYDLEKKILGLIGVGKIGKLVAGKASAGLAMKVIGYDPYVEASSVPDIELTSSLEDVLSKADFVSLHLPISKDTIGLIGKTELEMMKPTAYLINAARGGIVRESDLAKVLADERIAGAALDVYEEEPPDPSNPLLKLDNTILTPHNAALTRECMDRMALHAAQGIDEVLSGKPPTWPVNKPNLK